MALTASEAQQIPKHHKVYKLAMTGEAICLGDEIDVLNPKDMLLSNADAGNGEMRMREIAADIATLGLPIAEGGSYGFIVQDLNDVYVYGTNGKYLYVHVLYHG